MKRFIIEYANYKKNVIQNNNLMRTDIKNYGLNRIDNVLKYLEKGFLTIDETMNEINNPFRGIVTEE
jgi:hypothetical protein